MVLIFYYYIDKCKIIIKYLIIEDNTIYIQKIN